jgi:hypothetical protein
VTRARAPAEWESTPPAGPWPGCPLSQIIPQDLEVIEGKAEAFDLGGPTGVYAGCVVSCPRDAFGTR